MTARAATVCHSALKCARVDRAVVAHGAEVGDVAQQRDCWPPRRHGQQRGSAQRWSDRGRLVSAARAIIDRSSPIHIYKSEEGSQQQGKLPKAVFDRQSHRSISLFFELRSHSLELLGGSARGPHQPTPSTCTAPPPRCRVTRRETTTARPAAPTAAPAHPTTTPTRTGRTVRPYSLSLSSFSHSPRPGGPATAASARPVSELFRRHALLTRVAAHRLRKRQWLDVL